MMSATPVALNPALRINIDQTVTTAGLLNPARAPSKDTNPPYRQRTENQQSHHIHPQLLCNEQHQGNGENQENGGNIKSHKGRQDLGATESVCPVFSSPSKSQILSGEEIQKAALPSQVFPATNG
jgi:hypothetical protein